MKRILFVVSLAALASVSMGQSFSESFDTGPTGWIDNTNSTFGNTSGGDSLAFASGTWFALNNSAPLGASGWFCNPAVFAPHSGAGLANANFNNTSGAGTIDSFLMSPVETFNNGDKISFWTRTVDVPTFADRLMLKLSTSGSATTAASFTSTLLTINPNLTTIDYPNVWTQFTVTLSGLPGGGSSGRFAFDYNVTNGGPTGANSDFIGIDDVQYTTAPVPEPATMAVLGVGALALLRRRRRS